MRKDELLDRKNEMKQMIEDGCTYREVAEIYGISKQRVYQITGTRQRKRSYNTRFPNLNRWLKEKDYTTSQLCRLFCGGGSSRGNKAKLSKFLLGEIKNPMFTLNGMRKIVKASGMTFEELWKEESE